MLVLVLVLVQVQVQVQVQVPVRVLEQAPAQVRVYPPLALTSNPRPRHTPPAGTRTAPRGQSPERPQPICFS